MAITLDDAKNHLNIPLTVLTDDAELTFFVNTANEWITAEVTDPSTYRAQLATRMLVAHWWETQRGPAAGVLDDDSDSARGSWFSIPNKVKELLPEKHAEATTPQYDFGEAAGWPDPVSN